MSQKIEELMNLALDTPEDIRRETVNLNVGYREEDRSWELIVKYNDEPAFFEHPEVGVERLPAGYAILTVPEALVDLAAADPSIEYIEKPKNFYYEESYVMPAEQNCILPLTGDSGLFGETGLSGKGVLLAVIDSGLAYGRPEFRNADGTTRIRFLWDQTLPGNGTSNGFLYGREFTREEINQALQGGEAEAFEQIPSLDVSGHGTAVTGIAAASAAYPPDAASANLRNRYQGIAPEAELLIVKLGSGRAEGTAGYAKTTDLMRAIAYAVKRGMEFGMPLVINLSFGNTYGAHNGTSLPERFLNNCAEIGRTAICVGSGNEGSTGGHVAGSVEQRREVRLAVAQGQPSLSVQIWKEYAERFRTTLVSPGGEELVLEGRGSQGREGGAYYANLYSTGLWIYLGMPTPYSTLQEICIEMVPDEGREELRSGIWSFVLETSGTGRFSMYLPPDVVRREGTQFLEVTAEGILTIPSTAERVITVGAYDSGFDSYADFSGRGFSGGLFRPQQIKPDVTAPGVGILAPDVYGGYVSVSGTSFSTPFVSGTGALLMEWGIVRGEDPYLYGEKLKAVLRAGAQPLRGESIYPNEKTGYGAVCGAAALRAIRG